MFSAKDIFQTKRTATGYTIAKSLRFRSSASAYLSRTPGSAPTSSQKGTISLWFKGVGQSGQYLCGKSAGTIFYLYFNSSNQLVWQDNATNIYITNQVFRDPSAWYHLVVNWDTTQATAANRQAIYVNGAQVTSFATTNNYTLNTTVYWFNNDGNSRGIGSYVTGGYFDGYIAEFNAIDGQQLDPTNFGQTDTATGVWMPKAYSGTGYGTNGFYLKFTDVGDTTTTNVGYGKDSSPNANRWQTNNFGTNSTLTTYDSMVDTPTNYDNGGNGAGNYCTINPLMSAATLAEANLKLTATAASWVNAAGTMFVSSGKWYWEATIVSAPYAMIGVATNAASTTANYATATTTWTYLSDGTKYGNGATATAYGASFTTNDVIGVALDMDSGTLTFYKNNVSQGTAFSTGLSGLVIAPWIGAFNSGCGAYANFGQRPFTYTPPSGFKALCTQNLPTPTIGATSSTLANKYFDVDTYTATGAARNRTGFGFQPDFVWIKARNHADDHNLFDAVRGALLDLRSDTTAAEITAANTLTSFNSDGYSLGSDASHYGVNAGTDTYVAWLWKANGSGTLNQQGSINSTVSANVTAGFSIVTYTGTGANATVGHGLGVAPAMVIVKRRNGGGTDNWQGYHVSLGKNYTIKLNSTAAQENLADYWGTGGVTPSVFGINGSYSGINANTGTYVAYCFAEVAGYSKFGSYTGNGSADGPFVYCGFRPRYILTKRTDSTGNWEIYDTARDSYNVMSADLSAESSAAEASTARFDALSNGFKIRTTGAATNASGGTYIYAAFAETPFSYSRAR